MDHTTRAVAILRRAEAELRSLVSESASEGDYESVVTVASWARALANLIGKQPFIDERVGVKSADKGIRREQRSTRNRKRGDYPQFFRRAEQLIRVAWSKRDKSEYQHKAPYSAVRSLARTMSQIGAEGRVFSA